jgi:hypothetical protein
MPLRQTSTFQKQNLIQFFLPRFILHLPYGYLSVSQFMFYRKNALLKKFGLAIYCKSFSFYEEESYSKNSHRRLQICVDA